MLSSVEDSEDNTGDVSVEAEDEDGSEDDGSDDDNDSYEEHGVDVDSIVLPIFTQDLLLFTSVQMISSLNYPVFVKDLRGAICIAEFGWKIFVLLSSILKIQLCQATIEQGVVVIPHQSPHAFIKGKRTISLQMLVRALQKVNITYVTLVSYGMKMNYADCLFINVFNGPDIPRCFDIGRNVSTPSIPLFDLSEKTVRGTINPMFGNLGAGYGSVELILDATFLQIPIYVYTKPYAVKDWQWTSMTPQILLKDAYT